MTEKQDGFDEKACAEYALADRGETIASTCKWEFIDGARWQFKQDKVVIEKLQSELDGFEQYADPNSYINKLEKELEAKDQRIAELEKYLREAYGHSNCYCESCKLNSGIYWGPKKEPIIFGNPHKALSQSEGGQLKQPPISDEFLKERLPQRPSCPDCGLESLTGNVHEPECAQMKSESGK